MFTDPKSNESLRAKLWELVQSLQSVRAFSIDGSPICSNWSEVIESENLIDLDSLDQTLLSVDTVDDDGDMYDYGLTVGDLLSWIESDAVLTDFIIYEVKPTPLKDLMPVAHLSAAEEMGKGHKFFRTVVHYEVVSEDAPFEGGLSDLAYAVTCGDMSGRMLESTVEQLTPKEASDLLLAQGSDPSFMMSLAEVAANQELQDSIAAAESADIPTPGG